MQGGEVNILVRHFLQRPYRHPIFLDVLMVFLIVTLLLSLAMREMKVAVVKTQGVGAFSYFAMGRVTLAESFALSGTWPNRQSLHFERYDKPALNLDAIQGVINLDMQGRHADHATSKVLSLRPATGASNATLLWVCGSAAVPQGMQVSGANTTTLSRDELYVVCR